MSNLHQTWITLAICLTFGLTATLVSSFKVIEDRAYVCQVAPGSLLDFGQIGFQEKRGLPSAFYYPHANCLEDSVYKPFSYPKHGLQFANFIADWAFWTALSLVPVMALNGIRQRK
jgi:hypothetical protein